MKDFFEYKEEIYKCSKCGLCQSVCPVYKITKNECAVSRGKFILLNAIIQNELKLNKSVMDNIDLCTNCNACKDFCPSDIDAREIFASVRHSFLLNRKGSKIISSIKLFELKMRILQFFIGIFRALKLDKITSLFLRKKNHNQILFKKIRFLNSIIPIKVKYEKKKHQPTNKGKVFFFEGCFNKYINPSSKNASIKILEELGYEVLAGKSGCCGINKYYEGHFEDFTRNAKGLLKDIPSGIDFIVVDCDCCNAGLKKIFELADSNQKLKDKVVGLSELLIKNNYTKKYSKKIKYTYSKTCSGENSSEVLFKNN